MPSNIGTGVERGFSSFIITLFLVAIATTLVLPGRKSPQAVQSFLSAMAGTIRSVLGIQ